MMTVRDLDSDQLLVLKQAYLCENSDEEPSWGELAAADELVSDETIYDAYGAYWFTEDDFGF